MRLRIDLAYDGTAFSGFAIQRERRTVQGELEESLGRVLRTSERVQVTVAGRTDAGVHARGQVCHCDLPEGASVPERVTERLNAVLPADVRVRRVTEAHPDFDARFAAIWRRYAYRVCDDVAFEDPLRRHEYLRYPHRVDTESMNEASARLLGEHDFAAFCKKREGASTVRWLREFRWVRDAEGLVVGEVLADSFCHSMVRALVGALLLVGEGKRDVDWPRQVLLGGVRDPAVMVARPHGLTLEAVGYPSDDQLALRVSETRRPRTEAASQSAVIGECVG